MIAIERITGLVLAGGRGMRMGSVDKGLQTFRGAPLVAHALRRLTSQVGTVLISANRNRDRYEALGCPVFADTIGDHAGPLAGLHAGLLACRTEFLAAVPCDAPFLPLDLVARLSVALTDEGSELAMATTAQRSHPVFCLMRRSVVDGLASHLASGGRAVHGWIDRLSHSAVSFDDEEAFRNINTVDELQSIARDP